jgi:plasmid stabilization system protein ParE
MAKEIKWTPEAEETYDKVIEYLERVWTPKEISHFIVHTEKVLHFISENPLLFRKSNKRNIHEALITPHNLLLFRVKPHQIELITFFDTRQDPKKKRKRKN